MPHPIDESIAFVPVRIAVLTVSDTRTAENDTSGDTLARRIEEAGHVLAARALLRDDVQKLAQQLTEWIDDANIDCVISTGGTGLTGRDVTVEAMKPLFDKEIDGFSALFHQISFREDRHLDHPVAGLRRRRARHLSLRPARLDRRCEGWLGRHPQMAARHPPPALQPRRDHAAPAGAIAARSAASSTSCKVCTKAMRQCFGAFASVSASACSLDQRTPS